MPLAWHASALLYGLLGDLPAADGPVVRAEVIRPHVGELTVGILALAARDRVPLARGHWHGGTDLGSDLDGRAGAAGSAGMTPSRTLTLMTE